MRIAIMQPGYLPWLGFFELMHNCDLFVIFDDVQYTKKDWRSRNRIRSKNGWFWLTVPVLTGGKRFQLISEARIDYTTNWQLKHLRAVEINYCKARFFKEYFPGFKEILSHRHDYLIDLDLEIIYWLSEELGVSGKPVLKSSTLGAKGKRQEKVIEVCKKLGARELYDSKAASNFLNVEDFKTEGINIIFQNYDHPAYAQVYEPFIPYMSTIDLLFNCGQNSLPIILNK